MDTKRDLVILLVEDNNIIRTQVSDGLSRIFDTVFVAEDGAEALKVLDKIYIDVVISDINMPNIDGIELIKEIRKREKVTPIIVTTAHDDFKQLYSTLPNIQFLVKPYSIYDIIKCINKSEELILANQQNEHTFRKLEEVSRIAKDILKQLRSE